MGGKRFKNEAKEKKVKSSRFLSKFFWWLIFIFLFLTMFFSGLKIVNWLKENNENKNIMKNISTAVYIDKTIENSQKYQIDFETLKNENSEVVGWLKVYGTSIEYPILKTSNNSFYMTHSFDKTENSAGWAFVDYKNKLDDSDKNSVIYAHNRRDGSMFGTLKYILTDEWQNNQENFVIPFITENEKAEYQVFSVYQVEKEDYYITTNFKNDEEFEKFVNEIKLRSVKDFQIEVGKEDQILTLSTCADNNKYRVVLHAKKILQ